MQGVIGDEKEDFITSILIVYEHYMDQPWVFKELIKWIEYIKLSSSKGDIHFTHETTWIALN